MIAVIVVLGFSVPSLIRTVKAKKREHREKLLNEIIAWAIDIIKSNTQGDFSVVLQLKTTEDKYNFELLQLTHLDMALQAMLRESRYMSKITLKCGQNLHSATGDLIEYLTVYKKVVDKSQIDMMTEFKKDPSGKFLDRLDRGIEYGEQLTRLASKVIEEALKIQTKDIN